MEHSKPALTQSSEEHSKLNKDFLLLTALIKNHKSKSALRDVGSSHSGQHVRHHGQSKSTSQQKQTFIAPIERYTYKELRTPKVDGRKSLLVKVPQEPGLHPGSTSTKGVQVNPMMVKRSRTDLSARDYSLKRNDSYKCMNIINRPQPTGKHQSSSSSQKLRRPENSKDGIQNNATSSSYRCEKYRKSTNIPCHLEDRRRRVVLLPDGKFALKGSSSLQSHRLPGASGLSNFSPSEQKKLSLPSGGFDKISGRSKPLESKKTFTRTDLQCSGEEGLPNGGHSARIDAVRTACMHSLAALEEPADAANDDERIQNKDCEIARIKALAAYLEQLEHKRRVAKVEKAVDSGEFKKNTTPTSSEGTPGGGKPIENPNNVTKTQKREFTKNQSLVQERNQEKKSGVVVTSLPIQLKTKYSVEQVDGEKEKKDMGNASSDNPEKLVTARQQIQELRNDIKRLESKLDTNAVIAMAKIGGKRPPNRVMTTHGQSTLSKDDRLSSNGSRFKMIRKSKVRERETDGGHVSQGGNPFKKVKSSQSTTVAGSRSLHKTRSRYKVRSFQRERNVHSQTGQKDRRGVRKFTSVIGQSSPVRPPRTGKRFGYSPNHHQQQAAFPRARGSNSLYRTRHQYLDRRYSMPYAVHGHRNWRGLWADSNRNSFVSRRLQHVVAHSPMLYRYSPFVGRKRLHHLGSAWRNPCVLANQLRWQAAKMPKRVYGSPLVPLYTPTRLHHHLPSRASRRWIQHSASKHSIASGKTGNKKVMNVVKLGGVRYARHGKSLRRLSSGVDRPRTNALQQLGTNPTSLRKVTNTKIAAQQVLQRSIFYSRISKSRKRKKQEYCMFFNRFGRCNKGSSCPYKHDPDKVAVCTRFLRGTCKPTGGGPCPFSHKVSRDKMPVCRFFLRGICTQVDCPYSHVKVNNTASVCRDFVRGFCPKGEKCTQKHLLECAEFSQKGTCSRKHCPLRHKKKGRQLSTVESSNGQKMTNRMPKETKKSTGKLTKAPSIEIEKRKSSAMSSNVSFIELEKDEEEKCPEVDINSEEGTQPPLQIRPIFMK